MSSPLNKDLKLGMLHTGRVVAADPRARTVDVELDTANFTFRGAQVAAGVHSAMIGLRSRWVPGVGTRVVAIRGGDMLYVMGTLASGTNLPQDLGDQVTAKGENMNRLDRAALKPAQDRMSGEGSAANDMLEGEWNIESIMGAGLDLLIGLAALKGGDLARVEACVLNDMVRIVSDQYVNMSSFGDFKIYRDGNRVTVKWNGTSYDHEGWGCANVADPKAVKSDEDAASSADFGGGDVDPSDAGRNRFSMYMGHLGDWLNLFYHDPLKTLGTMAGKPNNLASGKARLNIGPQGEFLVQSTESIVLERVTRILVPQELKRFDDPTGTAAAELETMTKDPLKIWQYSGDMHDACFHLRNQARWLANYHNLARFWQDSTDGKDWHLPDDENEIPAPTADGGEADRADAKNAKFIETYSTIRMMADGSIVIWDGYGSAITMGRGNIRMTASKNFYISAAGSIVMEAGQDFNVVARRNIEMAALNGGFTATARSWFRAFCEKGTLWLRSDAAPSDNGTVADDNAAENPPARMSNKMGVIIEAGRGRIGVRATDALHVTTDSSGDFAEDDPLSGIQIKTHAHVRVDTQKDVLLHAQGFVNLSANMDFVVHSSRTVFDSSVIGLGRSGVVRGASFEIPRVVTSTLAANSVMTNNGGPTVKKPDPDTEEIFTPKPLGQRPEDLTPTSWETAPLQGAPGTFQGSQSSLGPSYKPAGGDKPGYAPPGLQIGNDDAFQSITDQFLGDADEVSDRFDTYVPNKRLDMVEVESGREYPPPGLKEPKHKVQSAPAARLDRPGPVVKTPTAPALTLQARTLKYIKTAFLSSNLFKR